MFLVSAMTVKPTKTMTEDEIELLVGAGPYELVRASKDVLRDELSPSCELCRAAIVKGIVFRSSTGREFVVGCDCAKWLPGKRRAVSMAIAEMERERKAGRTAIATGVRRLTNDQGFLVGWKLVFGNGDVLRAKPVINAFGQAPDGSRVRVCRVQLNNRARELIEAPTEEELLVKLQERINR